MSSLSKYYNPDYKSLMEKCDKYADEFANSCSIAFKQETGFDADKDQRLKESYGYIGYDLITRLYKIDPSD